METQTRKYTKKELMEALVKQVKFAEKMLAEYEDTILTTMKEYYSDEIQLWTAMIAYMGKRIPADKGGPT